jgi:hypothetical protein
MDITITFHNGRWLTDPNPAIVVVGTGVRWIFQAPVLQTSALLWKVHFAQRMPFGENFRTLEVNTQRAEPSQPREIVAETLASFELPEYLAFQHRGTTRSHVADDPGDYKYDLSIENASSGELLGEDDPTLYVVRGIIVYPDWIAVV